MLKSFIKIAWRNIKRNKLHSIINLLGLSVGLTVCLTLYQIITYERSFDRKVPASEQVYRIYARYTGKLDGYNPGVPTALYQEVKEKTTGLDIIAPIFTLYNVKVELEAKGGGMEPVEFDDIKSTAIINQEYFKLLEYEWVLGNPESSLEDPFKVVLTEESARRYFGDIPYDKMMGKDLVYNDSISVQLSGIVKKSKTPTDFFFTDFLSYGTYTESGLSKDFPQNNWNNVSSSFQIFIRKNPLNSVEDIEKQLAVLEEGSRKDAKDEPAWKTTFKLQALSDLHFNKDLGVFDRSRAVAHLPTLYALGWIAFILLVMAGINFINLATAQAFQRGKEVGVRKVLGGTRNALIRQFLIETYLITLLAMVISIGLTEVCTTYFYEFMPDGMRFNPLSIRNLLFILLIPIVLSLLSGFYPAFILSGFKPVLALKNQIGPGKSLRFSQNIRKGLIVLQFTVSIALILGTIFIAQQIHYLLNKDLGFKKDAIVYFYTPYRESPEKRNVLKEELGRLPDVEQVSLHQRPPSSSGYSTSFFKIQLEKEEVSKNIQRFSIDDEFLSLYEIPLIAGRTLIPSDTLREYIANEALAGELGLNRVEELLDIKINGTYPIVGVVKDFHLQSLHKKIAPLLISQGKVLHCTAVRIKAGDMKAEQISAFLSKTESIYQGVFPGTAFTPYFLDETIEKFYRQEERLSKLSWTAMLIAVFISCLGLFGLISFTVVQRTKEIGIRKVLGASVSNIVGLLSGTYLKLVGLACLLSVPLAWYYTRQWLEDFAYRIGLSWWIFAIAAVLAVLIAFLTIGIHSIKAALANPVDSLRSE